MDAINPVLLQGSLELMVLSTLSGGKKYGLETCPTLFIRRTSFPVHVSIPTFRSFTSYHFSSHHKSTGACHARARV